MYGVCAPCALATTNNVSICRPMTSNSAIVIRARDARTAAASAPIAASSGSSQPRLSSDGCSTAPLVLTITIHPHRSQECSERRSRDNGTSTIARSPLAVRLRQIGSQHQRQKHQQQRSEPDRPGQEDRDRKDRDDRRVEQTEAGRPNCQRPPHRHGKQRRDRLRQKRIVRERAGEILRRQQQQDLT